ncbi:MAG: heavy-metal-associated domain-containing protein [Syntrophomonadaceae bacterium]
MNQLLSNIVLILDGMNNIACENQLTYELLQIDGIQMVDPNFIMSLIVITYLAAKINPSRIISIIESLGYGVRTLLDESKIYSNHTHCS